MKRSEQIILALFILSAYVLMPGLNRDLLLTIEEYNLYVPHSTFYAQMAGGSLFGFMRIWACWFTQHFYYPWLGSSILILMLLASILLLRYACRLKGLWILLAVVPSVLVIWHIVGIDYHFYRVNTPGYFMLPALQLFMLAIIVAIISAIIQYVLRANHIIRSGVMLFTAVTGCAFIFAPLHFGLSDKQFKTELAMNRALNNHDYDVIISRYNTINEPTSLMVLYKNIALMHTGHLTEMFTTGNNGTYPASSDTLSINLMAGADIYYQLGEYNYAYRLSMENAVKHGLTVSRVKMLARCAIMNREMDLAYKYLTLLRRSPYHRTWALEHDQMLRDFAPLARSRDYQDIQPFCSDAPNVLDSDGGLCLNYIIENYSSLITHNPNLEDMVMCCALWNKDDGNFMYHFANYVNSHQGYLSIPLLYQEAAYMFAADRNCPYDLSAIQFDNLNITQRYLRFVNLYSNMQYKGKDRETIARELMPEFGRTYWYYFYFNNDFKIY